MRANYTTGRSTNTYDWDSGTTGDLLDRLDGLIGRIGMNNQEQSRAILTGMDAAATRLREIENPETLRPLQVQFDAQLARLRKEAGRFLRELGGRQALVDLRAAQQPPAENVWWFLDDWLEQRRKASFRRSMRNLAIFLVAFAILAVIYQAFLAPDPALIARIGHENAARAAMLTGDFSLALSEIDQGLAIAPDELTLLVMRGVVFEASGRGSEAAAAYQAAEQSSESREEFLLARGQAYTLIEWYDAALADAEAAIVENPQSAPAYLLAGQVYEMRQDYFQALDEYEKAARAADALNQAEFAAIARTRIAFVMQTINLPQMLDLTATP